jgi:hypothetical protein
MSRSPPAALRTRRMPVTPIGADDYGDQGSNHCSPVKRTSKRPPPRGWSRNAQDAVRRL